MVSYVQEWLENSKGTRKGKVVKIYTTTSCIQHPKARLFISLA